MYCSFRQWPSWTRSLYKRSQLCFAGRIPTFAYLVLECPLTLRRRLLHLGLCIYSCCKAPICCCQGYQRRRRTQRSEHSAPANEYAYGSQEDMTMVSPPAYTAEPTATQPRVPQPTLGPATVAPPAPARPASVALPRGTNIMDYPPRRYY